MQNASLRLDWSAEVYQEPFFAAQKLGYYKAAGINLTILPGESSGTTIDLVGAGKNTFGFGDAGTMMLAAAKGEPVKNIAVIQRRATFGVECFKSDNVTTPGGLVGKSVLLIPSESTATFWPAFLKANHISPSSVHVVNADYSDKVKLMATHRADCMAGVLGEDLLQAKLLNSQIGNPVPFYANGIEAYGMSLIAGDSTVSSNPTLVKNFVTASVKGWKWVCSNQKQALAEFLASQAQLSSADRTFQTQMLPIECQKLNPGPGDSGQPLGPTSSGVWTAMQNTLREDGALTSTKPAQDYYTNQFISRAG